MSWQLVLELKFQDLTIIPSESISDIVCQSMCPQNFIDILRYLKVHVQSIARSYNSISQGFKFFFFWYLHDFSLISYCPYRWLHGVLEHINGGRGTKWKSLTRTISMAIIFHIKCPSFKGMTLNNESSHHWIKLVKSNNHHLTQLEVQSIISPSSSRQPITT